MTSHTCTAIVFTCIDWRLHPQVERLCKEKYGTFDLCATAGAIKGFEDQKIKNFLLEQIAISHKLHEITIVVLTAHHDCGAYGGVKAFEDKDAEIEHHKKELEKVASTVSEKFPNLTVETYFLDLHEEGGTHTGELKEL